jgi:hypothetical protein
MRIAVIDSKRKVVKACKVSYLDIKLVFSRIDRVTTCNIGKVDFYI